MISGGADSMALMAWVADFNRQVERRVCVHHCHHGVAEEADHWARFVDHEASKRQFTVRHHKLALDAGSDFERRAREARYTAVESAMAPGDVVMTAHHRDDQVETLLLRLAQGSGLIGLAGIPSVRQFGPGVLVRPLLNLTRRQILQSLAARGLDYVTDPSNQRFRFRRNLIRWKLLPALSRVSPTVRTDLLKLSELAADRVFAAGEALGGRLPSAETDRVLLADSAALIGWQVRFYCQSRALFSPSRLQIEEFARQCLTAPEDRLPELSVGQSPYCLRRWQGHMYWVDRRQLRDEVGPERHERLALEPNTTERRVFPSGVLEATTGAASIDLEVFYGVEGRSFRLGRARPLQSLKQLGQTLGVPPWLRRQLPLIAVGDLIIGWGDLDTRSEAPVSHTMSWSWTMHPMQDSDSTVS